MITNSNNDLYHYGMPRRSGRYPWGSGANPFHHKGKSGGNPDQNANTNKSKSPKKPSEEMRQKIINSGDAELVSKYKQHLTTSELHRAMGKIQASQAIDALAKSSQKSGMDKVEEIMDQGVRIADNVDKGLRIYNTIARTTNAFAPEPVMPVARDYSHLDIQDFKRKKYDALRTEIHAQNALEKAKKSDTQRKTEAIREKTDLAKAKAENLRSEVELHAEKERTKDYINAKQNEYRAQAAAEKAAKREAKAAKKEAKKEFQDKLNAAREKQKSVTPSTDKEFNDYIDRTASKAKQAKKLERLRANLTKYSDEAGGPTVHRKNPDGTITVITGDEAEALIEKHLEQRDSPSQKNVSDGEKYTQQWLDYMDRLNK